MIMRAPGIAALVFAAPALAGASSGLAESFPICPNFHSVVTPGQPCPPPGPFQVFFEPGSTELSPQSVTILENLLEARQAAPNHLLVVGGHADRLGSDRSNTVLARRRAEAVARFLVDRRVPEHLIRVEWFGEMRPAVPTPDGIAESQNRRVEIRLETGADR